MRRNFTLAVAAGMALVSAFAHAAQISPGPNPFANVINVAGGESDVNEIAFINNGGITVSHGNTALAGGLLTNTSTGTLTNYGYITTEAWNVNSGMFINQGIVENYGLVEGPNSNQFGATFNNYVGATAGVGNYGYVTNAGTLSVVNYSTGVVDNSGLVRNPTNYSGGVINNSATGEIRVGDPSLSYPYNFGSLGNYGTINNDGAIVVNGSSSVTVYGDVWGGSFGAIHSDGTIDLQDVTALFTVEAGATVDGTGTYTQDAGTTRVDAATVDTGSGPVAYIGRLTQGEIIINDGYLVGTGVVESTDAPLYIGYTATVAPGNSAGTLTVDGDLEMHGIYEAQVDGLGLYDVLNVTGTADLTADSLLTLAFSYAPSLNDSFDLLVADQIIGEFGFVDSIFPAPPGGGGECTEEYCPEAFFPQSAYTSGAYGFSLDVIVDAIGSLDVLRLTITSVPAAAVPLPGAVGMFGGALAWLAWMRRRGRT